MNITVRHIFFARFLSKWKAARKLLLGGDGPLLGLRGDKFRENLNQATTDLGLAGLDITPHTLRYGGATIEKAETRLSDHEIQNRGNWKDAKTYRVYVQMAGLMEQLARVPESLQHGTSIVANTLQHFNV